MKIFQKVEEIESVLFLAPTNIAEEALLRNTPYITLRLGHRLSTYVKSFKRGHCQIYIAKTGIGLINASSSLTSILNQLSVDAIILLGLGGALDSKLKVGDLVVAGQVLQHDSKVTRIDRDQHIYSGELCFERPYSEWTSPYIPCDPVLTRWMLNNFRKDPQIRDPYIGSILSGSEFVACEKRNKELGGLVKDAMMLDMESAAIAQIANKTKTPFAIAKIVADRVVPVGRSAEQDYQSYLGPAAEYASKLFHLLSNSFGPASLDLAPNL